MISDDDVNKIYLIILFKFLDEFFENKKSCDIFNSYFILRKNNMIFFYWNKKKLTWEIKISIAHNFFLWKIN